MVKCSVVNCSSSSHKNSPGLSFHRFPKDEVQRRVWLKNINLQGWKPKPSSVLCSKHFEQKYLDSSAFCTRLRPGAVPTLFVQASENCEILSPPGKRVKTMVPVLQEVQNILPSSSRSEIPQIFENESLSGSFIVQSGTMVPVLQDIQTILPSSSRTEISQIYGNLHQPGPSSAQSKIMKSTSAPISNNKEISQLKDIIIKKNKKIKALRQQTKRLKTKVNTFSEIISDLRSRLNQDDVQILSNIPVTNKEFFLRYLKKAKSDTLEKSYSPELRSFALQLHFYSPRAYDFVRTSFNTVLPHPGTLSRWYKKINVEPGFISESFDTLEAISKSKSNKVFVNVIIDEMVLRKGLVWDSSTNKNKGYIDTGAGVEDDSLALATQALVIIVNAINSKFMLPIAFFFISAMTGEQRAGIMKIALQMLHAINIFVCGITFDGAASNICMATNLGCELSICNLKPNFIFKNNRINIFYDPCHMLKLIRNTVGDFKILVDKEGNQIKFEYFSLLLDLQNNKGLHLANKIKQAHIYFNKQKMKVRLAAQLLSKSVADALLFCKNELELPDFVGCDATVKFINVINDAFDVLNSRSTLAPGYKKALCAANFARTKELAANCKDYLLNLKFMDGKTIVQSGRKTGFLGFIICLESALNLYEDLIIQQNLRFLPLYSISQDHIEMLFGKMRARGGFNDNPNVVQFVSSLKRILINTKICLQKNGFDIPNPILHASSSTTFQNVINETTSSFERNIQEIAAVDEENLESFLNNILCSPLDEYTHHVTVYIAGFIARKILKVINCVLCHMLVLGDKGNFLCSLINTKDRGGLMYPSEGLIKIVQRSEKIFKIYAKKNLSYDAMIAYVAQSFDYECVFNSNNLEHDINHVHLLIKLIVKKYIDLRCKHDAKETNLSDRNYLKKIVLFKNK